MFSAASVCLFVCQHDNSRKSKHKMMNVRCIVQKFRPSLNLGVITLGAYCVPPKMSRWAIRRLGKLAQAVYSLKEVKTIINDTYFSPEALLAFSVYLK